MRNPLQEQLLKAGLVKKGKADQIARDQVKARLAKGGAKPPVVEEKVDAARLQAERAERDRALAAERNAQAKRQELQAQVRQIVDTHKVKRGGELEYRFNDGAVIRTVLVNAALRAQLASGALLIVRHGDGVELIPRSVAEKIYERDASFVLLDHGRDKDAAASLPSEGDDFYDQDQFKVPDDLMW
ncbi:hypothetical protein SAMN05428989_3775 [Pseudoxanthomonas sp. GM95]|uniref:DUF2058 domain-containing protein n=1 Tax=Pseudoxanthomonas sp. GM95 TaxID=1881043 RepID=UPI0008C2490C|nr:DUF2058 domain-containing protein [Pseudoxanthomonas sp. GM95]SEM41069.1 hypothetical protein SAMN05428989_3775 [Pseudoxanthomonas sp. GM95]